MLSLSLLLATGVAACDTPSPRFLWGERRTTVVDGRSFTVWQSNGSVEIYRTSPELLARRSDVFAAAEIAVRQLTGCQVIEGSMVGDTALIEADIDCD